MLTIIILAGIAVMALFIGFFEIQLPFINRKNNVDKKEKKMVKESSKSIESFYRTVRMESWLYNIKHRSTGDIASSEALSKTLLQH